MKNKVKKILYSFVVLLVGVLVLVGSVWSVYADANITINGGSLKMALDEAAMVQVISNTMKKCINSLASSGNGPQGVFNGGDLRANADDMFIGTTNVPTGVWLENLVQNKVDDGDIWCTNNKGRIAMLFAEYVLGSADKYINGMICDARGEKGGMYNAYSTDGPTEFGCASAHVYRVKTRDEIRDYLKTLYEERRAEVGNAYWSSWDNLDDYTSLRGQAVGYWMYRRDFAIGCESNDKETTLQEVSLDYGGGTFGKVEDSTVRVRSNWESKKFHNALGTKMSCKDLKEKMGSYSSSYSEVSVNYLASQCKAQLSPFIKNKLEEYYGILYTDTVIPGGGVEHGSDGYSQEALDKMRAYYEKWKDYTTMNDREFVEVTEKGGYQCNTEAGAEISFTPVAPVTPGGDEVKPTCASSGGAESLGWIVCPILSWMGRASNDLYNYYIEPALNVKPALFNEGSGENDDVKDAWGIFQNIANIVFVILFLIVIFSQLTGVGIDNYGIKKILPKLIVAAILVNVSYYICLIFIDLSNIVGNGIQNMFNGMSSSLTINSAVIGGENIGSEILSTSVTGAVLLGALVVGGVAVWQNPAILLTLLISGLGVVISILFLFLILAAREAAIVVLTVISPLAFVCYILPNTKNLFDRWRKMGEGLLLVYPICGLLVGGGSYVSKLLLASGIGTGNDGNGFFGAFSAMLISVVPIFFIPTVLRSSFAAMGNLGAKISGFGQRLSTGSQRFLREREGYKNAQKMGLERRTRIRAGLNKDGQLTPRGERMANRAKSGFGRLIGSDKRRAALISQAKRDISTSEAAGASLTGALARAGIPQADALPDSGSGGELGTTFAAGTENAYYGGQFLEAASRNDITGMNSAIEAMRASGMKAKDIAKIVRYGQNHGYYNGLNANTRSTWMRDLSKKYGNDFLATDFELNHFAATGGAGNGGVLGNYGVYAGTNTFGIDDVKPEDILKLSGDSLAGMISSGKIDQGMAQRVMAMNPNISADKRIMLGALASGAVGAGVNVDQFKNDAKALASNRNASSTTITPSGSDSLATLVSRWTAPTAQRATVVQEFFGEDDRQIRPVDVSIAHGNNGTVGSGPNAGAATAGETFMVRGQHGDVTFTQGNDGQWRDENGRVVEDFDRFRRGVNEFRANRNNSQNGNNANAGQNNSQPQNPQPRDNTPNNA